MLWEVEVTQKTVNPNKGTITLKFDVYADNVLRYSGLEIEPYYLATTATLLSAVRDRVLLAVEGAAKAQALADSINLAQRYVVHKD